MVLIVGIILLSLGDLAITLIDLRSTGMMEANPIAGYFIRLTQSVSALAAYKMLSVTRNNRYGDDWLTLD